MTSARRFHPTDRVLQAAFDLRDVQLRAGPGLKTNGNPTLVGVHRHRGNIEVFVGRARAGSLLTLLERFEQLLLMPGEPVNSIETADDSSLMLYCVMGTGYGAGLHPEGPYVPDVCA